MRLTLVRRWALPAAMSLLLNSALVIAVTELLRDPLAVLNAMDAP